MIATWGRFLRLHESDIQLAPDGGVIFLGQAAGYVLWDTARACLLLGRDEEALRHATDAAHVGGPPEAHLTAGIALERLGRPAEAIGEYRAALEGGSTAPDLRPRYAKLLNRLGQEAEVGGREARARAFYEASYSIHPDPEENADAKKGLERLRR